MNDQTKLTKLNKLTLECLDIENQPKQNERSLFGCFYIATNRLTKLTHFYRRQTRNGENL